MICMSSMSLGASEVPAVNIAAAAAVKLNTLTIVTYMYIYSSFILILINLTMPTFAETGSVRQVVGAEAMLDVVDGHLGRRLV